LSDREIGLRRRSEIDATFPPDVPANVEMLIRECWLTNPDQRPSLADVLENLKRMRYQIRPDVKYDVVEQFLAEVGA
jgi:hypothetical protein